VNNRDKTGCGFSDMAAPATHRLDTGRERLWVVDNINYGVLVYDNTGEWPVYRSSFPLRHPRLDTMDLMGGTPTFRLPILSK